VHNTLLSNSVAKIIEVIGTSDKGWKSAVEDAVDKATKTLRGIHGIEVTDMTATVNPESGKIIKYRTCVKVSFALDYQSSL
jgi:dodecin